MFRVVFLVLVGVVFFGCSKIDRYANNQISSSYKHDLTQIVDVSFVQEGKCLHFQVQDIKNPNRTFDIENVNLIQNKQIKEDTSTNNKDSSTLSSFTLYADENMNLAIKEKLEFSERTHRLEHSVSIGFSGDNINTGKIDTMRFIKKKLINLEKKLKAFVNADGTVSLYSTVTNKKLLTIKLFRNKKRGKEITILGKKYENTDLDSWLAITPEGYYVGSDDAYKYFDVDKYYEKFYRPEVVKLALQGETMDNLPSVHDIKSPPIVEILNGLTQTDKNRIKIKVAVTPKDGGVGKIQIYRNGTAISYDTRAFRAKQREGEPLSYEVQLLKGENEIKAVAFDSTNHVSSESAVYRVHSTYKKPHKKSIYALVVGIQEFDNTNFNLENTITDANMFRDTLLTQQNNGLFYDVKITHLNRKDLTTKENILKELKKMQNIHPEDLFVLYVGSHGKVENDGKYYLIPSDISDDSSQSVKRYAISEDDIKELIGNIQTAEKFIVFDTCNSGKMVNVISEKLLKENKGVDDKTAMNTLGHSIGKGSMIMSASTSQEVANEMYKNKYGLFTYVLVNGLKGEADREGNNNGDVETSELKMYVYKHVKEISAKDKRLSEQSPIINDNGELFTVSRVR